MRRFMAGAVLGVLFLAPPAPAQYGPGDPASLVASWYAKYLNRQPDPLPLSQSFPLSNKKPRWWSGAAYRVLFRKTNL